MFFRVKIWIDIRKPLMHGVTISRENGGKDRWCPLMFGFLLDFFYWCGVIGHTEKLCTEKSEKCARNLTMMEVAG
jgi:hypothetical protein